MEEQNKQNQPNDYELQHQQQIKAQQMVQRRSKIKKVIKTTMVSVLVVAPIIGLIWYAVTLPPTPESDIISKKGLHWHPELTISIKGQKQEIPANIGLGAVHNPIHTHDASGQIHLEMQGLVKREDLRLGQFFKVWEKQFSSACIFDACNVPNGNVKMLVNGTENIEFENYEMKDKDKIEIKYE